MPLVKITTNVALDAAKVDALASSAHNMIKKVLGKPDQYIAVDVIISPNLQFGGNREPAAVCSVQSIGFGGDSRGNREAIVGALTEAVGSVTGAAATRVFVALEDVKGEFWGWNGSLLG